MGLIHIGGKTYEIVHENRNGWNAEAFRDRYSEVLERYDFIVGDWGYNQLRLKGFFRDNHQKATKDSNLSGMPDYINEYCNFGCAYFVLEKTISTKKEPEDYDLDADDGLPRLEAADLRAAAGAGYSEVSEAGDSALEEVASAREAAPMQERHTRSYRGDHRHGSSNRHNQENRKSNDNTGTEENRSGPDKRGNGGKREAQHRKSYRGNDQRSKKPYRLAASETAAASAEPNGPKKRDTERS
ncbi:YutD family protein [Paenibacillus alkaliterrae]|uniref:YutD family protein n=1 Tax=Paenibacillus alkaliterrae TaxID=320909 RepID=UPI001F16FAB3|nr:YutD family protein [Paenibacillus alkaliterrae]MCF2940780.1 YutD family protein [Paenibacillus alkaliterrae]